MRIERVKGEKNVADALSRLIENTKEAIPFDEDNDNHFLFSVDAGIMSITWEEIERASESDTELQSLQRSLDSNKWPKELRKFEAQRNNIYRVGALLFKGDRSILPAELRVKVLKYAHGGHVGESAMKRIMREFFWWPGMSVDTTEFVKSCETCAILARKNPPLPLSSRVLPDGPWEVVQIDFLSIPGCGTGEFLIVIDTYSRYLSVVEMRQKDARQKSLRL
ncbi:uncharacterized protein K02A2.6-like [Uranotaenia lowii]|uniref:uncharacterized protein K02A2.6-like n=1 Tax=Uranotaenia lowii TaxID=190385 RepID=UPI0024790174|nr:uncharacterized protein K02A2.6-like [Uranotaenia lowii]